MTKLYYLAHPYTCPNLLKGKEWKNVELSIWITSELLDKGYNVFNPLTHTYDLHEYKPREVSFLYGLDLLILERCDSLILCDGLTSWRESKGCMLEYEKALELGLEVLEYKPRMEKLSQFRLLATRRVKDHEDP